MTRRHAPRSGSGLLQASLLLRCGLIGREAEQAYMQGRIFHGSVKPVLPVNPTRLCIFDARVLSLNLEQSHILGH